MPRHCITTADMSSLLGIDGLDYVVTEYEGYANVADIGMEKDTGKLKEGKLGLLPEFTYKEHADDDEFGVDAVIGNSMVMELLQRQKHPRSNNNNAAVVDSISSASIAAEETAPHGNIKLICTSATSQLFAQSVQSAQLSSIFDQESGDSHSHNHSHATNDHNGNNKKIEHDNDNDNYAQNNKCITNDEYNQNNISDNNNNDQKELNESSHNIIERPSPFCAICINPFQNNDIIHCLLPCHHAFHKTCIRRWLKDYKGLCPLCMEKVDPTIANSNIATDNTALNATGGSNDHGNENGNVRRCGSMNIDTNDDGHDHNNVGQRRNGGGSSSSIIGNKTNSWRVSASRRLSRLSHSLRGSESSTSKKFD